jgi:hypothetical protein
MMTEKAGAVSHELGPNLRASRPGREKLSVIRQIQLVSPVLVYYPPVDLIYTRGRWTRTGNSKLEYCWMLLKS